MRALLMTVLWFGSLGFIFAAQPAPSTNTVATASTVPTVNTKAGRILKVLPFLLDRQGRDSTSPSLFDRDAYQAQLREHITNQVFGVRFDVQWKAHQTTDQKLKVRVEVHGVSVEGIPTLRNFETNVVAGTFSRWTKFTLTDDDYKKFGSLVAWRATLWNDNQLLGEQKSFLW